MILRSKAFKLLRAESSWAAATAIATIALCAVAYYQLNESNKAARDQNKIAAETFLHNLKTDFFTPDARKLISLIEMDALKFRIVQKDSSKSEQRDLLLFEKVVPSQFKPYVDSIFPGRSYFLSNEIDDFLLNHFEDLGILYNKHLITKTDIYDDFSYYIAVCHENTAIEKYIATLREDNRDNDIYKNFDLIYHLICEK